MEITKEQLKELLREHLTIEIKEREDMYKKDIKIIICFDGEEITSDSYSLERKSF